MLARNIATGVLSVFEQRDCDYSNSLPERTVEFTEDESLLNMSALGNEVVQILGNVVSTLIDVNTDSFTIGINSVELKCRMVIFYDLENNGIYNIKEFAISEVCHSPPSPASASLNDD